MSPRKRHLPGHADQRVGDIEVGRDLTGPLGPVQDTPFNSVWVWLGHAVTIAAAA